jgi:hypothetical protein
MSHIAEGLLHAHLDGALAPDDPEWARAKVHLEQCDACRGRLEEARQLRGAVGRILAGADAPGTERPAFADLIERARSGREEHRRAAIRGRPPWWRSPAKLAWAASLVLAVGAGWMGRGLLVSPDLSPSASEVRQAGEIAADRLTDAADDEAHSPAELGAQATPAGQAAEPAPVVSDDRMRQESARADEAPADARAADADVGAGERDVAERALRQAPLPAVDRQEFAAKAGVAVRCYAAGEAAGSAELRLWPDGSARLRVENVPYVGFWEPDAPGELNLRLSDGGPWLELGLRETDGGVHGTLAPSSLAKALSLSPVACGGD